jgi:hypothetical protein
MLKGIALMLELALLVVGFYVACWLLFVERRSYS